MQSAQRRFEFLKSGRKHKKGAGGARTHFLSGVPLTLFDGPQDLFKIQIFGQISNSPQLLPPLTSYSKTPERRHASPVRATAAASSRKRAAKEGGGTLGRTF